MGQLRAGRLLSAFIAAQPAYDLVELMLTAGLPARLAGRAVEAFGSGAQRLLKDDPWRLLQLSGIEVADADAFARAAIPGVLQADSRRSRALVGWSLSEAARDGHTLCSVEQVTFDLQLHRVADPAQAIADACAAEVVESIDSVVDSGLALARYAEAERSIAEAVHRLTDTATVIGKIRAGKRRKSDVIDPDGLDPVQRSAVNNALDHGVSVLTGGPGTGKSRTVATVVREAERAGKS
ncbi:MAG: exodeoxyribonuclease alpha subunit, partial [Pseudonocardiales bacterium]|nr:exodeoxyribonuclease alpha subunit [Pseudonocardiales bacterium]